MNPSRLVPITALLLSASLAAQAAPGNLEQRVERLERVVESRALMQMQQRLDELEQEVARLRGRNEELQHALDNLKLRQRELYLDTDRRLQALEAGGAPATAANPPATAATAATAARQPSAPAAPAAAAPAGASPAATAARSGPTEAERKAYKQAFELLKQGRYQRAIAAFEDFLKRYPDSGYAANAQYWLGEAHYVNKQYPEALKAFRQVLKRYPKSGKVPDAKLKLGFTHYELGQWKQARKTLEALVREEQGTSIARLAAKRLKRMKQEGH